MPATILESMRAVEIATEGGPEVLRVVRRPVPQPAAGELLIRIAAAGVNRVDVFQRLGIYRPPAGTTDIPGVEFAGEVVALGPGARRYRVGDRVCALVTGGGYAEYCVAPEVQVLPVPAGFDMVKAAGIMETFCTVWTALYDHGQLPVRSVKELIAYAKAGNPVNFASSGVGTTLHLAGEMLKGAAGINLTHVPYKGSGPALNDLMGGQVQMMFDNLSTAMPLIRAGKLRPLAVTTRSRTPLLPDVPTMVELGFENFEASVWFGLFAPRNTPRPIVDRLAREVAVMLADPRTPPKLAPLSMDVMKSDSPEKFAEFFRQDAERWRKVVAAAGVKLDKN